jgi:copper chaperone CopZ
MKKSMTALAALLVCVAALAAQSAPAYTRVTLEELHCAGCARRISEKVTAVPGVAEMRVDLEKKTIFAIHKPSMTPSPKALWNAIEQTDHTPIRMDTPTRTYTSKPQS